MPRSENDQNSIDEESQNFYDSLDKKSQKFYKSLDADSRTLYKELAKVKEALNAKPFNTEDVIAAVEALGPIRGKHFSIGVEANTFKVDGIRKIEDLSSQGLSTEEKRGLMRLAVAALQNGLGTENSKARIFAEKVGELSPRNGTVGMRMFRARKMNFKNSREPFLRAPRAQDALSTNHQEPRRPPRP